MPPARVTGGKVSSHVPFHLHRVAVEEVFACSPHGTPSRKLRKGTNKNVKTESLGCPGKIKLVSILDSRKFAISLLVTRTTPPSLSPPHTHATPYCGVCPLWVGRGEPASRRRFKSQDMSHVGMHSEVCCGPKIVLWDLGVERPAVWP